MNKKIEKQYILLLNDIRKCRDGESLKNYVKRCMVEEAIIPPLPINMINSELWIKMYGDNMDDNVKKVLTLIEDNLEDENVKEIINSLFEIYQHEMMNFDPISYIELKLKSNKILITEEIKHAIRICVNAHAGQYRKPIEEKIPYIIHPCEVAMNSHIKNHVFEKGKYAMNDLVVVGLLHDVIEDNPNFNECVLLGNEISRINVNRIKVLSRNKKTNYFDFIQKIIDYNDSITFIVKIEDIRHNLIAVEEGSLKDKYRFALNLLEEKLTKMRS